MEFKYFRLILKFLLIIIFCEYLVRCESEDCFRAAVYQHLPLGNYSTDESDLITELNMHVYQQIATEASKQGVNILVFPEDGIINGHDPRSGNAKIAEQIPDPKTGTHNPCENPEKYKNFKKTYGLSCFAKTNRLYIVADYGDRVNCDKDIDPLCPKDGFYLFNTAVAFAPDGTIVAKYHKMQLFFEFYYDVPHKPEFIYFDTPFGRIGLFICFDIIFRNPGIELINKYGVQTMIFPTWWFDEVPYRTAQQIQEGWALTNKVNLLAPNMHQHYLGSTGSGIYSGENGQMVTSDIFEKSPHLLIADIPIDSKNSGAKCLINRFNKTVLNKKFIDHSEYKPMVPMNLENSALIKLNKDKDSIHLCHNHLCCKLEYTLNSEMSRDISLESFWFFVANHSQPELSKAAYPVCEEICGIFRCDDEKCHKFSIETNKTVFNDLEISGKMSTNYVYPSATTNHLKLVPINHLVYENNRKIGSEIKLSLKDFEEPLLSFVLYGRCYDKDPQYKQK